MENDIARRKDACLEISTIRGVKVVWNYCLKRKYRSLVYADSRIDDSVLYNILGERQMWQTTVMTRELLQLLDYDD
jgi:hypothetical protein